MSEHDPHLAHHFDTPEQQYASNKLGMWIFLATEVLFFGGLFCAYAIYRGSHPEIFYAGHQYLDKALGGINTVVLILSSLTMALGVRFAQLGQRRNLVIALVVTVVLAFGFLGIKGVEYSQKWKHGLLWGRNFDPHTEHVEHGAEHGEAHGDVADHEEHGDDSADGADAEAEHSNIKPSGSGPTGLADPDIVEPSRHEVMASQADNVHIFFGIYFAMTGLHGLHVIIGIGLMFWLILRAARNEFGPRYFIPVDTVGLYWHLVDLIWIFLFPLLYLIE